jgi:mono/diheme cytochrome c family protein
VTPLVRLAASGVVAVLAVVAALLWSNDGSQRVATSAGTPSGGSAAHGRAVFEAKGCVVCHEQTGAGPELTGLGKRAGDRVEALDADAYVRQSVRDPQAFIAPGGSGLVEMPTLAVNDRELDALTQYLLER